jgi:DNA-directed RNA polymerase subunit RPC12/RpoP
MATCAKCGKKLGLFNGYYSEGTGYVCKDCSALLEQEANERAEQRRIEAEQRAKEISKIILTTGDFKEPYGILDTIIALDAHEAGYFSSANPSTAFDGVKNQLRTIAYDMGADAVICCQFEYRVAVGQGLFGSKQAIEIFAYGTAVKLQKEKTTTNGG